MERLCIFAAARRLAYAGALFWIAETCWFGWNMTPQSDAERVCDRIAMTAMTVGFLVGWRIQLIDRGTQ